jgi:hypothetical protein
MNVVLPILTFMLGWFLCEYFIEYVSWYKRKKRMKKREYKYHQRKKAVKGWLKYLDWLKLRPHVNNNPQPAKPFDIDFNENNQHSGIEVEIK